MFDSFKQPVPSKWEWTLLCTIALTSRTPSWPAVGNKFSKYICFSEPGYCGPGSGGED